MTRVFYQRTVIEEQSWHVEAVCVVAIYKLVFAFSAGAELNLTGEQGLHNNTTVFLFVCICVVSLDVHTVPQKSLGSSQHEHAGVT